MRPARKTRPHETVAAQPAEPILLDTSALYAVFDGSDSHHTAVAQIWEQLVMSDASLYITNYVLLETIALLQRRLGARAVEALHDHVLPWVRVIWVDETLHREALAALRIAGRRDLSLVDCVSFTAMRRHGLGIAFTMDRHFAEQGFRVLPA